jgi:hypothetical protein
VCTHLLSVWNQSCSALDLGTQRIYILNFVGKWEGGEATKILGCHYACNFPVVQIWNWATGLILGQPGVVGDVRELVR